MEKVGDMVYYTFEECLDEHFGPIGTPERDEFEGSVKEAVQAYHLGEAIKKARLERHLTQDELGQRIGVKKSQISKIEKGVGVKISTIGRVFRALGVQSGTLDLGAAGRVTLW